MSAAEIKIRLFREIDKLGQEELQEAYHLLMTWLKEMPAYPPAKGRKIGSMQGILLHMAEDFDAPLDELKDYMP